MISLYLVSLIILCVLFKIIILSHGYETTVYRLNDSSSEVLVVLDFRRQGGVWKKPRDDGVFGASLSFCFLLFVLCPELNAKMGPVKDREKRKFRWDGASRQARKQSNSLEVHSRGCSFLFCTCFSGANPYNIFIALAKTINFSLVSQSYLADRLEEHLTELLSQIYTQVLLGYQAIVKNVS